MPIPADVLSWIYESAWAITEASLETIISIAKRENFEFSKETLIKTEGIFKTAGMPLDGAHSAWLRGSIAVIPVIGPIFPRANLFTEVSGATSIQNLTADFKLALQNKEVKGILFYDDSPGGQVTGTQELANLIFESRSVKPIKGYIYGQGASAAYNLISATSEIVIADTGVAGSVGVISAVRDTREKEKREGVKTIEFVSSVSPNKTINFEDDKSLAKVQRMVDTLGQVMVQNIAKYRGVSPEAVLAKYGQGDVFVGAAAVEQGLADRVGTFDALLQEMESSSITIISKGGITMNTEELKSKFPETYEAVRMMGKREAEATLQTQVAAATEAGAKAERERIQGIESIKLPGAQATIAKMKFDPKATKESVALAIVEGQQEQMQKMGKSVQADAIKLAEQSQGLQNAQEESTDVNAEADEKAALAAMVDGINS